MVWWDERDTKCTENSTASGQGDILSERRDWMMRSPQAIDIKVVDDAGGDGQQRHRSAGLCEDKADIIYIKENAAEPLHF